MIAHRTAQQPTAPPNTPTQHPPTARTLTQRLRAQLSADAYCSSYRCPSLPPKKMRPVAWLVATLVITTLSLGTLYMGSGCSVMAGAPAEPPRPSAAAEPKTVAPEASEASGGGAAGEGLERQTPSSTICVRGAGRATLGGWGRVEESAGRQARTGGPAREVCAQTRSRGRGAREGWERRWVCVRPRQALRGGQLRAGDAGLPPSSPNSCRAHARRLLLLLRSLAGRNGACDARARPPHLGGGAEHDDVLQRLEEDAGPGLGQTHGADGLLLTTVLDRHVAAAPSTRAIGRQQAHLATRQQRARGCVVSAA